MSHEQFPGQNHEQDPVKTPENAPERHVSVEAEQKKQHELHEQAKHTIEQEALSSNELEESEQDTRHSQETGFVGREAKAHNFSINLNRARRHLSAPDRVVSKLIHNPVVDQLSEVGSKTVARPIGLLSGGFCALLATSFLVYYTKHNGIPYNFGAFIAFFVGGYVVGIVLELLWKTMHGRKEY